MGRLGWYVNRLRAMNPREVLWRLDQKRIQMAERRAFAGRDRAVDSEIFDRKLRTAFAGRVGSMVTRTSFPQAYFAPRDTADHRIRLLGDFDYDNYATDWHAGFQTSNRWPKVFSYDLNYKQRDDIGDARTNWELNRHFQFALLAENYAATADEQKLAELTRLFDDWNRENPFLTGISWTSPMEVAIRAIQWLLTDYYLSFRPQATAALRRRLETGVVNMVGYVATHRSRYSSANNHLLVEAASVAIAGKALGYAQWESLGVGILDEEIDKQNSPDGVNLEMALHYQSFAMEAYALVGLVLGVDKLPSRWREKLAAQVGFLKASLRTGGPLEFGDNDEGKIVYPRNPAGHYAQVIEWLEALYGPLAKECDDCAQHFAGGYTFLSDKEGRVGIAIDHAPLGFGSIAAHGHADALSFQASVDGHLVFVDPGTYIYHCWIADRDYFRRTINHNTLCVDGADQSQMLGAFLWGKKAKTTVDSFEVDGDGATLRAHHDGYAPTLHTREFRWDASEATLQIVDTLSAPVGKWATTLMLAPDCEPQVDGATVRIFRDGRTVAEVTTNPGLVPSVDDEWFSPAYGVKVPTKALRFRGNENGCLAMIIRFIK